MTIFRSVSYTLDQSCNGWHSTRQSKRFDEVSGQIAVLDVDRGSEKRTGPSGKLNGTRYQETGGGMRKFYRALNGVAGIAVLFLSLNAVAQFSSTVQGDVQDQSGAAIPKAIVTLTNLATRVTNSTTADSVGVYHFASLGPGSYTVSATAAGFSTTTIQFALSAAQVQNIPVVLRVATAAANVVVTGQAPLLDTSDSRIQTTLDTQALQTLPTLTLNPTAFIELTPGVTGVGVGTTTNYFTENAPFSANGRGTNSNLYILDGLDINIDVNAGVLSMVPNSDSIAELTVQPNTYAVDYGRVSSIQTVMTTKSGTTTYHGFGSEYYQYQGLNARGEFGVPQPNPISPYHQNNMSFGLGGPILPHHHFFFYFTFEPFLAENSTGNQVLEYEDPAFVSFATAAQPNSPEVGLMTKYPASGATTTSVAANAQDLYGTQDTAANTGCGTPSTDNIPCGLAVLDNGYFNSTSYQTDKQFGLRIDKYFKRDRLYGTWFRSTQFFNGPNVRPAFATTTVSGDYELQGNETHTFSPNMLNEASFGYEYLSETTPASGLFNVPVVGVSSLGVGWGDGFALGQFAENNYHWRDVLTRVVGAHVFKVGYEGWHGTDVANFAASYSQPSFGFGSMIDFINNDPYYETGLAYNPLTGQPAQANYEYAMTTGGAFGEDTWKATRRLTLNYGLRYDNYGNAYPVNHTILANFHLGSGSTFAEQVANGVMTVQGHVTAHDQNWIFSPRVGVAWDPTGTGKWAVHGGIGVYHDWITLGNEENGMSDNPPAFVVPVFFPNSTTSAPIFSYGTSNTYPFGFTYPKFGGQPLNAAGGFSGQQVGVGGWTRT